MILGSASASLRNRSCIDDHASADLIPPEAIPLKNLAVFVRSISPLFTWRTAPLRGSAPALSKIVTFIPALERAIPVINPESDAPTIMAEP
ncbi:hypothetical protein D3C81_2016800 [compost metagenome]